MSPADQPAEPTRQFQAALFHYQADAIHVWTRLRLVIETRQTELQVSWPERPGLVGEGTLQHQCELFAVMIVAWHPATSRNPKKTSFRTETWYRELLNAKPDISPPGAFLASGNKVTQRPGKPQVTKLGPDGRRCRQIVGWLHLRLRFDTCLEFEHFPTDAFRRCHNGAATRTKRQMCRDQ
jgi:hypothetical protein